MPVADREAYYPKFLARVKVFVSELTAPEATPKTRAESQKTLATYVVRALPHARTAGPARKTKKSVTPLDRVRKYTRDVASR